MLRYLKLWRHYAFVLGRRDARRLAFLARSEYFDASYYLRRYPDVAAAGIDPVIHYVDYGAQEKRNPSPYFNTANYLLETTDVLTGGINPLEHYLRYGRCNGKSPGRPCAPGVLPVVEKVAPSPPPSLYPADISASPRLPFRYVVYTAIVGGYDDLKIPSVTPANCDFVVFSDYPFQADNWKVVPVNYLTRDPTRAARFIKLHPHIYFPEYSHSIWMDGNVGVRGDVGAFFDSLTDIAPMAAFAHPLRDCVYQEGLECIVRHKDHEDVITRHLERHRARGIGEHLGLWETNVVARRHNDPACIALMESWWKELDSGSRRDQLSLPVVLRDLPGRVVPLDRPGVTARQHPLLTFSSHRTQRSQPDLVAQWPAGAAAGQDVPPLTVAICVHNSLDVVRDCLASAAAARRAQDTIVIVDDASDSPTASYLDRFAQEHDGVRLLRNPQNLGYTRSANRAMKAAETKWVVLLNSDTVLPRHGLTKLVAAGERFPRLAVVGPLSNAASWQSVPRMVGDDGKFLVNRLPRGTTVEEVDRLCQQSALDVVPFVPLVNGFCLALRKDVLEELDYFDAGDFPMGYGEEDDFCLRVAAAGYVCGIATDTFVYHAKSATFTASRREPLVAAGRQVLARKHGEESLHAASSTMRNNPGLRLMRHRLRILLRRQ
jgi:GT2 family glycosyltransferase